MKSPAIIPNSGTPPVGLGVDALKWPRLSPRSATTKPSESLRRDVGTLFNSEQRRVPLCEILHRGRQHVFKLIATMRRGTSTGLGPAWARYPTVEAARLGTATLLRDERILRVMIVRNEIPPAFVEWADR